MKKLTGLFTLMMVAGVAGLFVGCVSGPKSLDINALESKNFTLIYVGYMTNMNEYNKEIPQLFAAFPLKQVIDEVEAKFGVTIDTSLFDAVAKTSENIKSYNLAMPNYFINADPEKRIAQQFTIHFRRSIKKIQ